MAATTAHHLMISGRLWTPGATEPAEARRGMATLDAAGQPVGIVAGVLIAGEDGYATHLVIGCDPPAGDYRLLPVGQIAGVDAATIHLALPAAGVAVLPRHEAADGP